MALLLAHRPFRSRAGVTMLWCVGGFGAFTVLFGFSRSLILSMIALMLVGLHGHGQRGGPLDTGAVGYSR